MPIKVSFDGPLESVKSYIQSSILEKYCSEASTLEVKKLNFSIEEEDEILTYDVEYDTEGNEVNIVLPQKVIKEVEFEETLKFALSQVELYNSRYGFTDLILKRVLELHKEEIIKDPFLQRTFNLLPENSLKMASLAVIGTFNYIGRGVLKGLALEHVNVGVLKQLIVNGLNISKLRQGNPVLVLNIIGDNCWRTIVDPEYANKLLSLHHLAKQVLNIYNSSLQTVKNPSRGNIEATAKELTNLLKQFLGEKNLTKLFT